MVQHGAVSDGSTLSLYIRDATANGDWVLIAQTDMTLSGSPNTALTMGTGDGGDWNAGDWTVGRGLYNGAHGDRAKGFIDEVRISDSALTISEFLLAEPLQTIIFVDDNAAGGNNGMDWENAFLYLQDALAYAGAHPDIDEIWVAAGTYYPDESTANPGGTNNQSASFELIEGVSIYGGLVGNEDPGTFDMAQRDFAANETILSGDIGTPDVNTDNSYHVVVSIEKNETAVLDGFTVTAGGASTSSGGGMYNDRSSPTVANCTFRNNSGSAGGGMFNSSSNPILTNCIFSGNWADWGAGMWNYGSSPTMTNCTFSTNNGGVGGGMYNEAGSNPVVTDCNFSGNSAGSYGGGMANYNNSSPAVTDCNFSGNSAGDGGGMSNHTNSSPTMTNCTFSGNYSASSGGGIYNNQSRPTVTGCRFLLNNTGLHGGGMHNEQSSSMVINCDFSQNTVAVHGGGMMNNDSISPTVINCTFSQNIAGGGGGGIANSWHSSSTVTNCVLTNNTAAGGGGIYNYESSVTVTNCILWGNATEILNDASTSTLLTATYRAAPDKSGLGQDVSIPTPVLLCGCGRLSSQSRLTLY